MCTLDTARGPLTPGLCLHGQVAKWHLAFLPGMATELSSVCGLSGHRHAHDPAPALKTRAKALKARQKEPEHSHLLIRKIRIVTGSLSPQPILTICEHPYSQRNMNGTVAFTFPGRNRKTLVTEKSRIWAGVTRGLHFSFYAFLGYLIF